MSYPRRMSMTEAFPLSVAGTVRMFQALWAALLPTKRRVLDRKSQSELAFVVPCLMPATIRQWVSFVPVVNCHSEARLDRAEESAVWRKSRFLTDKSVRN